MFARQKKNTPKNNAHPVDVYVGRKIRQRRIVLGLSQEKLANDLGITFQQVQKYENGSNRVSSSRLYDIGKILDSTISFFFDGFESDGKKLHLVAETSANLDKKDQDVFLRKETAKLVKAYYMIDDENLRKNVLDMVKNMANTHKKTKGE
jgi:transcriptional regulator with XRE-family HTH domain